MVERSVYTGTVDGSNPSLPKIKMYAYWNDLFFYIGLVLFLVLSGFYVKLFKQSYTFFLWIGSFFSFFFVFFLFISLFLNFRYGKFLLYFFFKEYNLQMILRDPQELLDILFGFAFWIFLFLFFVGFLFYITLFLSNLLRKEEYGYYKFFKLLFVYFISISIFLFIYDLSFFHTDVFKQQSQFKFEPDMIKWYLYYESEYIDFLLFLILALGVYIFLFSLNYAKGLLTTAIIKLIPLLFFISFFCYFFGGESLSRDIYILFFSFLFCEILNYTTLTLYFLRRYK